MRKRILNWEHKLGTQGMYAVEHSNSSSALWQQMRSSIIPMRIRGCKSDKEQDLRDIVHENQGNRVGTKMHCRHE